MIYNSVSSLFKADERVKLWDYIVARVPINYAINDNIIIMIITSKGLLYSYDINKFPTMSELPGQLLSGEWYQISVLNPKSTGPPNINFDICISIVPQIIMTIKCRHNNYYDIKEQVK